MSTHRPQHQPLSTGKFIGLLIWSILMSLIIVGVVLALWGGEVK